MKHNTSIFLYISAKALNRRCGLKLLLFHEVPFGISKLLSNKIARQTEIEPF
jgi:hypothetical protein